MSCNYADASAAGLEANRPPQAQTSSPPTNGSRPGSRPASVMTAATSRIPSGSSQDSASQKPASPTKPESEAERLVRNIHIGQQEKVSSPSFVEMVLLTL